MLLLLWKVALEHGTNVMAHHREAADVHMCFASVFEEPSIRHKENIEWLLVVFFGNQNDLARWRLKSAVADPQGPISVLMRVFLFQLYELDSDPKRKEFLDDLFTFMQKRGKRQPQEIHLKLRAICFFLFFPHSTDFHCSGSSGLA